jgi:osmotically-inducible protein OsmY
MFRKLLPLSLASLLLLQGCVGVLLAGGATGGVMVAKDRRKIELNVRNELTERTDISRTSHISVHSNNGIVLLVGQTPHQKYSDEVKAMAERQDGVRKVYNEIKVEEPIGYDIRTNDSWITSKVRTMLIAERNFDSSHIKVVTEDSQVYLMGMVTRSEGDLAVEIARNAYGVTKVIRVFEYVSQ